MDKVQLGNSEIKVSPITFGAWAIGGMMWGGTDKKAALRALQASIDIGITSIDTAPVYGMGLSEEIVGEAIKGKRDQVQVLTKAGMRWDQPVGHYFFTTLDHDNKPLKLYQYAGKESVIQECEDSLQRLKTDYIDLYQIHWPDPTTPIEETMEALELLIKQGKILAAGVSNYSVEDMEKAEAVIRLASNQLPYSMVRREMEQNEVPYCLDKNISIIVYSPLQRGILTGKIKPGHHFNEGDSRPTTPWYKEENLLAINHFLDKIRPIAESKDASLAQLVIKWTLQMPGVTTVLAGARDEKQVKENAGAIEINLTDEEMKFILDQLDHLELKTDNYNKFYGKKANK